MIERDSMTKSKTVEKEKEIDKKVAAKTKKTKAEAAEKIAEASPSATNLAETELKLKKAGPKKARAKQEQSDSSSKTQSNPQTKEVESDESTVDEAHSSAKEDESSAKPKVTRPKKTRSKKYQAVRAKVDRTRTYDIASAIELVKKLSMTKFVGTISAHLVMREVGISREVALPHSTGKSRVVEIANEATLTKIEAGQLDFDVLISTPQFMSKLTKFAPVLGPKGLMPNPKSGTLTTNPEQRQKELQAGSIMLKTERKAPLIHASIGKTDMSNDQLAENVQALLYAFKGRVRSMTLVATMSPGVKVGWEE